MVDKLGVAGVCKRRVEKSSRIVMKKEREERGGRDKEMTWFGRL